MTNIKEVTSMLLRRFSALALLMLSLGTTAAIATPKLSQTIAQVPQEPGPPMRDGGQLFEKLNLTAAQKQKIQAIRNQYKDQMAKRREAMRQSQQELMNLMSGTAPESQIREKHRQVLAQGQQMAELQFDIMLAMRQVLTPEQRRQLAQMMQERRDTVRNQNRGGNRPQ